MSEEKNKQDFSLEDYKYYALIGTIAVPPIFWFTTSTNPITETYHFLIGVESSKIAVTSFLIVCLTIYFAITLTVRKIIRPKTQQPNPVTDIEEENENYVVSSVFSPAKEYQQPPVINWDKTTSPITAVQEKKNNEEVPVKVFTSIAHLEEKKGDEEKLSVVETQDEKFEIGSLANKLLENLNTTKSIDKAEKDILGSLNKVLNEKISGNSQGDAISEQPVRSFNEKGYTEEELKILDENLNNVVSKTQKRKIKLDTSNVPDLFSKKNSNTN